MKTIRLLLWIATLSLVSCMYVYGDTSPLQKEETMVFFPTIGYPVAKGALWELHIHGWIYEPNWVSSWREWFTWDPATEAQERNTEILPSKLASAEEDEAQDSLFKQRTSRFFVDNQGDKQIAIRIGEKSFTLDPSTPNGHFTGLLHLMAADIEKWRQGHWISFKVMMPLGDSRQFTGQVELLETQGISVVSDIDDTIKVSQVRDKSELFNHTFRLPFQAVSGMSKLYRAWATSSPTVSFHYVSASPWQLSEPLSEFISSEQFPLGSFHLRLFRWKDSSLFEFFQASQPHKIDAINSLLACCQERRFILVGDSGEHDPEIYAQIARKYPQRVIRILIRDVTGEGADSPRYQEVFKELPTSLWHIFSDPATIETKLK